MALLESLKSVLRHESTPPDGQMELVDHLSELRIRIFRALAYTAIGMCITYYLVPRFFGILLLPLAPLMAKMGVQIAFRSMTEGFLLWMQVCFVAGLALAAPFVILEIWGFIAPALTPEERKPVTYLAPFSVLLFLAGVGIGYACLPATFTWMASYLDDFGSHVSVIQDATPYILLTVKIMLAFGIAFQLPILLLFLARVGIINAHLMTTYWRHAVVGISIAAAVLTPSNDPLTMLMMAIPMAGLYLLSIGLVRAFEPKDNGSRNPSLVAMLAVALVPLAMLIAVGFWLSRTSKAAQAVPAASPTPIATVAGTTTTPVPPVDTARIEALNKQVEDLTRKVEDLTQRLDAQSPQPAPTPIEPGQDPTQQTTGAEQTGQPTIRNPQ